jgi:hypothetical protein
VATAIGDGSSARTLATILAAVVALFVLAFASVLAAVFGAGGYGGPSIEAAASSEAQRDIPEPYLALYRDAGHRNQVPWQVLAGIGSIETDHGRSNAAGVRSGVNRFGCCAGPMQLNLTDGPPSTWERYGVDGNHDGREDVYDPEDAIPSAANYVPALLKAAGGDLGQALLGYNHSAAYVNDVLARARAYMSPPADELTDGGSESCAGGGIDTPAGPAELTEAERVSSPRAFRVLPSWAMSTGRAGARRRAPLRRRRLDPAPLPPARHRRARARTPRPRRRHRRRPRPRRRRHEQTWDTSAGQLAVDLGWTSSCAASGSQPACALVPAIQFIGYDRYPRHGSPRTCSGDWPAHIQSPGWVSPCYRSSGLAQPRDWVTRFPTAELDDIT